MIGPIPVGPQEIAVGIPADTLRQRPDVRSSERALAAATARIGVAQAQLLPALNLSGNVGTSALSIGKLGDVVTGGLFATLSQLIFDGGRRLAAVRSQRAAADGAFAAYRKAVLTALEDVENGLVALKSARERELAITDALEGANNAAILARSQYRAGLSDFQTLLDSERQLLSARDSLASAKADEASSLIQLYLALGGGWDPLAPLPDGRRP
jgi:outer membrane protein TolC